MSDDLAIGGPDWASVVTTDLLEQVQQLRLLGGELTHYRAELAGIDRLVSMGALHAVDSPFSAIAAERAIDDASAAITRSTGTSELLARALAIAADGYAFAEIAAAHAAQQLSAVLGYGLGYLFPALALVALPGVSVAAGGLALAYALASEDAKKQFGRNLSGWLRNQSAVLSDPRVVDLVRLSVMSVDDFGGGLLHLPAGIESLVGDEGLGILGLDTSAAALVLVAQGYGALSETPVVVSVRGTTSGGTPPQGFADRVDRIPTGAAQVRIDRYSEPDKPDRFEVYLAGTADFSLTARDDAWDMTSNALGLASGSAGSYRAAIEAMKLAGIDASSSVVFTGYSQGGLVAAQLASSGDYNTEGLYTLGAPAGQVAVPASIPYVALEHTEDLVPALGGTWASSEPVLVRRAVFDQRPLDTDIAFPAHQLSYYRQTAVLLDRSDNGRVGDALRSLNGLGVGTVTVESTFYQARRVHTP